MTVDLVAFLNARLDERAEVAEKARRRVRRWPKTVHPSWIRARFEVEQLGPRGVPIERFEGRETPQEVIVDVVAKRAILDLHTPNLTARARHEGQQYLSCPTCDPYPSMDAPSPGPCATLRWLALPFAGHPDFDPAWTVEVSA